MRNLSGTRRYFHKCDLVPINVNEEITSFAQLFGCKLSRFPLKYLGVHLHYGNLRKEDLQPVIDKIVKRVAGWRGRLLHMGEVNFD